MRPPSLPMVGDNGKEEGVNKAVGKSWYVG